jgi:hypothetical protein
MGRKEDLERLILDSDAFISEYRATIQVSADPVEKRRSERGIEKQQELIRGYLDEYVPLCRQPNVTMHKDIAQLATLYGKAPDRVPTHQPPDKPPDKERIHKLGGERSGIPAHLYSQLRTALLDCGPFATDRELKVIFADERLSPWRNRLPEANNPSERVEGIIGFLHSRHNTSGENALVLLLCVLSERLDPGDACHQRLADLASEFEREAKSRNRAGSATAERAVPQHVDPPTDKGQPSLDQARLTEALLACATVSDTDTRNDIVARLPIDIRDRIQRRPATRPDVINIVETCSNFEGGLVSLIEIVRFYEGPTLQMKRVEALLSKM